MANPAEKLSSRVDQNPDSNESDVSKISNIEKALKSKDKKVLNPFWTARYNNLRLDRWGNKEKMDSSAFLSELKKLGTIKINETNIDLSKINDPYLGVKILLNYGGYTGMDGVNLDTNIDSSSMAKMLPEQDDLYIALLKFQTTDSYYEAKGLSDGLIGGSTLYALIESAKPKKDLGGLKKELGVEKQDEKKSQDEKNREIFDLEFKKLKGQFNILEEKIGYLANGVFTYSDDNILDLQNPELGVNTSISNKIANLIVLRSRMVGSVDTDQINKLDTLILAYKNLLKDIDMAEKYKNEDHSEDLEVDVSDLSVKIEELKNGVRKYGDNIFDLKNPGQDSKLSIEEEIGYIEALLDGTNKELDTNQYDELKKLLNSYNILLSTIIGLETYKSSHLDLGDVDIKSQQEFEKSIWKPAKAKQFEIQEQLKKTNLETTNPEVTKSKTDVLSKNLDEFEQNKDLFELKLDVKYLKIKKSFDEIIVSNDMDFLRGLVSSLKADIKEMLAIISDYDIKITENKDMLVAFSGQQQAYKDSLVKYKMLLGVVNKQISSLTIKKAVQVEVKNEKVEQKNNFESKEKKRISELNELLNGDSLKDKSLSVEKIQELKKYLNSVNNQPRGGENYNINTIIGISELKKSGINMYSKRRKNIKYIKSIK